MTASGFSSRCLRSRSSATARASPASQARWNPPRPLRAPAGLAVRQGLKQLALSLRNVRNHANVFRYLIAGMIYFVLIGSSIFTYFITLGRVPDSLIKIVASLDMSHTEIILLILLAYILLGTVFDELSAMLITLPSES